MLVNRLFRHPLCYLLRLNPTKQIKIKSQKSTFFATNSTIGSNSAIKTFCIFKNGTIFDGDMYSALGRCSNLKGSPAILKKALTATQSAYS